MNSLPIRVVVVLGLVSVVGILAGQGYWLRRALHQEERQLDQRLFVGLSAVAARLAAYRQAALPNQSPVSQVASNYYVVNVNGEIDANLLDYFLRQEFARLHLHLDYEYAIYDCGTNRMVYGSYVSATAPAAPAGPPTRLPTYNRYTYYFGLYLPHRAPYLMSQLTGWLLTTGLLVLVVAFFGYALLVILRQKRLSEVQRDFINALSHEFKTPIATIALAADVLADPTIAGQPQRLLNYASIIREENRRLSQQVDKVLQLAKTEGRTFQLHRELVDLNQLLPDVARQFDLAGRHPAGSLALAGVPLPHPALVWADPLHLTNVLFNLLDNAVKYAAGPPVVRLTLVPNGSRLTLQVADEGIGIAAAHQQQVFDKFFRVPAANDLRPAQGFGLGLYYVRNVALAHGWRLGLRSQPGHGSTFTLTFPPVPK